jgi:hypothetical protein
MSAATRLVVALLLLSAPSRAAAQEADRETRRRELLEGTHVLRRILFDHDFRALERYEELAEEPDKTLLVVLGDLDRALARVKADVPGGLETFVHRGGAALLASDRMVLGEAAHEELRAVAGVSINHETYHHHDPNQCYLGKNYCPRLYPVPGGGLGLLGEVGADGRGALNVFTNVPSKLRPRGRYPGGVRPQATLPPWSQFEFQGRWFPDPERAPLFAVGGDLGDGRVLVLADHSVFINPMMFPEETNNVEFSYNAVRWLQGRPKQRDRVLFVEDGKVVTKLDIPLKSVAIPPEEILKLLFARRNQILVEAENAIARLEDDNVFNNRLSAALDGAGLPPHRLMVLFAVVATLVGVMYLFYRLGIRSRFRHDTTVPPLTAELGRVLPEAPLAEQRRRELLRIGDFREPAATLARRWFARMGLDAAGPEPAFEAAGGWWSRGRLLARLRRLWRLARGQSPSRLSPAELWRLQRELDDLSAGHQRGAWRVSGGRGEPSS